MLAVEAFLSHFVEGTRVNKIKFTLKYERDMINVCHVGSWVKEEMRCPAHLRVFFDTKFFYGTYNMITGTE